MGKIAFLFLFFLFVLFPRTVSAATYYVAINGSDTNLGTITSPWKTINYAADMLNSGDTLFIRGGAYSETVSVLRSGTSQSPITITGYPGETAVIDGNYSLPVTRYAFLLTVRGNYVTIKELEVMCSKDGGVAVTGDNVQLVNIKTHDGNASGIILMGDYDTVESSTVYNNGQAYENCQFKSGFTTWGSALSCGPGSTYGRIKKSISYNNWGEGISAYTSGTSVSDHCTIEDSVSYNNGSVFLYLQNATNATVQRNLIYRTPDSPRSCAANVGLNIGDEGKPQCNTGHTVINNFVMGTWLNFETGKNDCTSGPLADTVIANNTFVNALEKNFSSGYTMSVYFRPAQTYSNTIFKNNIILEELPSRLVPISVPASHPGLTFSNNLYSKTYTTNAVGVGDIVDDPHLAKTGQFTAGLLTGDWFKLLNGSPAIDQAVVLSAVAADYFSNPRGSLPDIGGHEYIPVSTSTPSNKLGDANNDGVVDGVDYVIWLNHYNETISGGASVGDFNTDGKVDGIDYVIWLNNY